MYKNVRGHAKRLWKVEQRTRRGSADASKSHDTVIVSYRARVHFALFRGISPFQNTQDQIMAVKAPLHHHIAGGQGPELSSLGFVWLRAENLIVQQHVISLKQIWKMLPKDKMISRPWNFVQRKWRICFKIKTVSVTRNLRHWDKIQVNKFNSKALRNWDYTPIKPGRPAEQWEKPEFKS